MASLCGQQDYEGVARVLGRGHREGPVPDTKQAIKEGQKGRGELRNPKLALRRLAVVKEASRDVARLWNLFIDRPEVLEAASSYGSD